jgi:hypothetical protein
VVRAPLRWKTVGAGAAAVGGTLRMKASLELMLKAETATCPAYVSIRQHTSAYVKLSSPAYVSIRQHTSDLSGGDELAAADANETQALLPRTAFPRATAPPIGSTCCGSRRLMPARVADQTRSCRHTPAYVSIRAHTRAYVSMSAFCARLSRLSSSLTLRET